MFEDALFASNRKPSRQRGWTALLSFALETVIVGMLVSIPLVFTDALPVRALLSEYISVPVPQGVQNPAPRERVPAARMPESNMVGTRLLEPSQIPIYVADIHESEPPAPLVSGDEVAIIGAPPGIGDPNGVWKSLGSLLPRNVQPSLKPPRPNALMRISDGVLAGLLIRKVEPIYPPLARQARIQGEVVLQAIIGKDGTIQNLRVVSGHPMLVGAAVDAVRQWRYRPYLLNHEPVDVETQITVNFKLS